MRASLAPSIGVACTAALVLPLALPSGVAAAPQASPPQAASRHAEPRPGAPRDGAAVPGSTQSLPLTGGGADRTGGVTTEQGSAQRAVRPFSLLGAVWDDAAAELRGTVQVRTRATGTHSWSGWRDLETRPQEHGADPGSEERGSVTVRGATAPLWVGDSDGVAIRVRGTGEAATAGRSRAPLPQGLPQGLRLDLVDPGQGPAGAGAGGDGDDPPVPLTLEETASWAVNADLVKMGATEIPALSKKETEAGLTGSAKPYIGGRPRIVTRKGWGADETLRETEFGYTATVRAAFVHHSATGNNYSCEEAPSVLRGIYRYHVESSGWRDLGYNFAIDTCGNIYEGRAGGVAEPVMGAHTLGFNVNSVGIAVLGTYSSTDPPAAVTTAIAKLTAWKLGLHGIDPRGKVALTSGGSNKYQKGTEVRLNAISGHRDGFATDCPGSRLYEKLGPIRTSSATYQGR
ncbi:peptidoglycan recognition protein [Streptomyces sp. NPDC058405]|uniref:peptidoglycan recognition protein family protein n=1 Tax=Streptomyces sp. NPDC058405 TaxID=3346482 RepID=UPI00365F2385